MNLPASFEAFLENHVNLNPDRIKTLRERVDVVETFLRRVDRLGDKLVEAIPQGSFAQRTIIKPPEDGDTFDADVLFQLEHDAGTGPEEYVPMLAAAFDGNGRYENKIEPGKRSVTLNYAGEFHIDMVPFIVADNGQFITNCETAEWEETNPQGFNYWLAERDEIAFGRLVEVIRLAKYLRECSDVEFAAPSVTLTLLLGMMVDEEKASAGAYADLPTAFISLIRDLDEFLQANDTRPELPDPTCDAQNFHDRWKEDDYARCRDAIHELVALIDAAMRASSDEDQLAAWHAIFGEKFTIPEEIVESERSRTGEQFIDTRGYGEESFPIRQSERVTVTATVEVGESAEGYRLMRRKNRVPPSRRIRFEYTTTAAPNHRVFWKAKNTGREAARANCFRGEIREGTPGEPHIEPTRYRGQHSMEVFIVVDGVCVARATHQVRIT
jgi:hypothetical protein